MKWALLALALASMPPLMSWLRRHPGEMPKIWMLVGFLTVQHGPLHVYMGVISWAGAWPGYTLGLEFSLLDLLAGAIYLILPRRRTPVPFLWPIAAYMIAVLLSALQAGVPTASVFYAWQLARVFLVFVVVAKACTEDDTVAPALLKGMAFGLFLAAGQAVWGRFVLGVLQTAGGFSHQNFLGLISHFIVFPFFALLLAGERGWLPWLVPFAGAVVAVLTTSRATVAFAAFGFAVVFMISIVRGWTPRKGKVALMGVVGLIVLAPLFLSSFEQRFGREVISSFGEEDTDRTAMENAASAMLADHPLGVGANHFVIAANTGGYYQRAGLTCTSLSAHVHNVYRLVAAETGYPGIITFVLLLLRPLMVAFACGWRHRQGVRGDLLLGLGTALLVVYLHSFFEWIFVTFQAQYIFAATVGLVAGLAQQLGYWQHAKRPATHTGHVDFLRQAPKPAPGHRHKTYP